MSKTMLEANPLKSGFLLRGLAAVILGALHEDHKAIAAAHRDGDAAALASARSRGERAEVPRSKYEVFCHIDIH